MAFDVIRRTPFDAETALSEARRAFNEDLDEVYRDGGIRHTPESALREALERGLLGSSATIDNGKNSPLGRSVQERIGLPANGRFTDYLAAYRGDATKLAKVVALAVKNPAGAERVRSRPQPVGRSPAAPSAPHMPVAAVRGEVVSPTTAQIPTPDWSGLTYASRTHELLGALMHACSGPLQCEAAQRSIWARVQRFGNNLSAQQRLLLGLWVAHPTTRREGVEPFLTQLTRFGLELRNSYAISPGQRVYVRRADNANLVEQARFVNRDGDAAVCERLEPSRDRFRMSLLELHLLNTALPSAPVGDFSTEAGLSMAQQLIGLYTRASIARSVPIGDRRDRAQADILRRSVAFANYGSAESIGLGGSVVLPAHRRPAELPRFGWRIDPKSVVAIRDTVTVVAGEAASDYDRAGGDSLEVGLVPLMLRNGARIHHPKETALRRGAERITVDSKSGFSVWKARIRSGRDSLFLCHPGATQAGT